MEQWLGLLQAADTGLGIDSSCPTNCKPPATTGPKNKRWTDRPETPTNPSTSQTYSRILLPLALSITNPSAPVLG